MSRQGENEGTGGDAWGGELIMGSCDVTPRTSECRTDVPHLNRASRGKLAKNKFEVVQRFSDEYQHQEIRDEERPPAVIQGHEREPPHVPYADSHGHTRQQKLSLVVPLLPPLPRRLLSSERDLVREGLCSYVLIIT